MTFKTHLISFGRHATAVKGWINGWIAREATGSATYLCVETKASQSAGTYGLLVDTRYR